MIAIVAFIVFVERSERRIPVQYAKRIVGRRMMGGQSTHLPLKVNSGGVMPVIFASSILSAPLLFASSGFRAQQRFPDPHLSTACARANPGMSCSTLSASFSLPTSTSRSSSAPMTSPTTCASMAGSFPAFVPGAHLRLCQRRSHPHYPGRRLYLIVISLIPQILISGIHLNDLWLVGGFFDQLPTWVTHGLNVNFYFGGTSLLIVVGVAMDTVNQVESQLIMRHYDGFSPRSGRVRGRRSW